MLGAYTCKTKVCELDSGSIRSSILFGHQYILWFQVPIYTTLTIKVVEA